MNVSIQRDLDEVRNFLESSNNYPGETCIVVYDQKQKGYRLEKIQAENLTNGEILAICKILLDSRAFPKEEIKKLLSNIITPDCSAGHKILAGSQGVEGINA